MKLKTLLIIGCLAFANLGSIHSMQSAQDDSSICEINITPKGEVVAESFYDDSTPLRVTLPSDRGISSYQLETLRQLSSRVVSLYSVESNIGNYELSLFGEMTSLRELCLRNNRFDDKGMHHLSRLQNLESLDISYNYVSINGLKSFLPQLTKLQCLGCKGTYIGNEGLSYIITTVSTLQELDASACELTDPSLGALCRSARKLKFLALSDNKFNRNKLSAFIHEIGGKTEIIAN